MWQSPLFVCTILTNRQKLQANHRTYLCNCVPPVLPDDQEEDYDEPQPVLPNCSSPVKAENIQINIQVPSLDVQEDYDEPQPVIPVRAFQQRVQQNDQNPESEPDYDEPVLSHRIYLHDSDWLYL